MLVYIYMYTLQVCDVVVNGKHCYGELFAGYIHSLLSLLSNGLPHTCRASSEHTCTQYASNPFTVLLDHRLTFN